MNDSTYNGWTNYATWRVNLEFFDGITADESFDMTQEKYDLGKDLQAYVEDLILIDCPKGTARDYAFAFLSEVNWHEIASHMISTYSEAT